MTSIDSDLLFADAKLDQDLLLNFDGHCIRFNCNSKALNNQLRDYYKHFLADAGQSVDSLVEGIECASPPIDGAWQVIQPDPGKSKVKEHFLQTNNGMVVRKALTGVHLFFLGDRRICAGPLAENHDQVVNFINNVFLDYLLARRGQLFHAAGVALAGSGVGLAGQSGKGKSTLALHLLHRGLDLVSNDRLVVYPDEEGKLRMHGIPKYPRINPGTVIHLPELRHIAKEDDIRHYESMDKDALWELEEKYDAFVEEVFAVEFKLHSTMSRFVTLDWDRHNKSSPTLIRVQPEDHPDLVRTIMKSPGVMLPGAARRIPEVSVGSYTELLSRCDFYVLGGGVDFDHAADAIVEILSECLGE